MDERQLLEETKERISDPDHWIKGDFKQPEYDEHEGFLFNKFCIVGAMYDAYKEEEGNLDEVLSDTRFYNARQYIRNQVGGTTPENFNDDDDTTHQMVMDALNGAIKEAIDRQ